jgi:hypothetical protein
MGFNVAEAPADIWKKVRNGKPLLPASLRKTKKNQKQKNQKLRTRRRIGPNERTPRRLGL